MKKRGTASAYLTGFGVVIPFAVVIPYHIVYALDVRNTCIMMSIVATPALVVPRCIEGGSMSCEKSEGEIKKAGML